MDATTTTFSNNYHKMVVVYFFCYTDHYSMQRIRMVFCKSVFDLPKVVSFVWSTKPPCITFPLHVIIDGYLFENDDGATSLRNIKVDCVIYDWFWVFDAGESFLDWKELAKSALEKPLLECGQIPGDLTVIVQVLCTWLNLESISVSV